VGANDACRYMFVFFATCSIVLLRIGKIPGAVRVCRLKDRVVSREDCDVPPARGLHEKGGERDDEMPRDKTTTNTVK